MFLRALRWAHAAVVLAGVLQREELVGIVHSYVLILSMLYVDGCVCKEATSLYIVCRCPLNYT